MGCVNTLVLLKDGTLASGADDQTIRLWSTTTGEGCRTLTDHNHWVTSLVVLQDGTLASGSVDQTIRLWNTTTGECSNMVY